jgi:ABC-type branched-subunit amino acid transport system substrate-binding protein
MKRFLVAFGVLALAGSAAAQETLKVGALGSMSGGGATLGTTFQLALRFATKEINDRGGIGGRPVQLVFGDTHSDPTQAVGEAKRLVLNEKVSALLGPIVSQEVLPTLPVSAEGKIIHISSASSLALTPQAGPTHFSISSNAEAQAVAMVNFAANISKAKSVAILSDDGGQSKSAVATVTKRLDELKIKLAAAQEYRFRADDMTPQLLALRRANPDVVLFIASIPEDTRRFVETLRDIRWNPPVISTAAVATFAPGIAKAIGPEAFFNVRSMNYLGLTFCPKDRVGESAYADYQKRLMAFDADTAKRVPMVTAAYFHDAMTVLKAAIEGAKSTDGPTVAGWLEKNGASVKLMMGPASPGAASHFIYGTDSLVMVEQPHVTREDGLQMRSGC